MKKQVIVIHGGDPARSRERFLADLRKEEVDIDDFKLKTGWKQSMQEKLGKGFEVFNPEMPNLLNARYLEWEAWFEKMIPFIKSDAVFVGHSLGAIFLVRYLSENRFPKKIKAVFLVAAPYKEKKSGNPDYFGGFAFKRDLRLITEQAPTYMYHSEDDPIVPFGHLRHFEKRLPDAHFIIMKSRGHFFSTKEFPELVKAIKSM